jgi:adenylate kinase
MLPLNLIMLGPPGAGKGTQAERFARTRGIPRVSTGDILREAVHHDTEMGRRVKVTMDRGELVGDEIMTGIVRERLQQADAQRGFVLDGFPRTVAQAVALDALIDGRGPLIVVDIVVPEAEIVRRLGTRMICADCGANAGTMAQTAGQSSAHADPERCRQCGGRLVQRADDSESVVRDRLRVYHHQTEPLVDYYKHRPTFRSVNGAQGPDQVAAELAAAIDGAHGPAMAAAAGARR